MNNSQPKPLQPHSDFVEMYSVRSDRNPKFNYVVAMNSSGVWSCSCPAWVYAKPRANCKHIASLLRWMGKQQNMQKVVPVKPSRFNIEV